MEHLFQPLARLGAFVVGVDASEENIKIAQAHVIHDPKVASNIKYIQATVEDLVGTEAGKFDAVVASEVVEHVAEVSTFVTACCQLIKVRSQRAIVVQVAKCLSLEINFHCFGKMMKEDWMTDLRRCRRRMLPI